MMAILPFSSPAVSQVRKAIQSLCMRCTVLSIASAVMSVSNTLVPNAIAPTPIGANSAAAQESSAISTGSIDRILDDADESPDNDSDTFASPLSEPTLLELHLDRLPQPYQPEPQPLGIDLSELILLPSTATASWLDRKFETEVAPLNARIEFRQELLQQLLRNPDSNDDRIRQVQSILSQLRAERDRIAIEHLLLVRQVSTDGRLPTQATNSGLE